jgi:serine/threonine-protein kinase
VELEPGTVLLGKYRIDALIGSGGMGNVVRASHLFLHQPVAIKILLPTMTENASTVQRFLREAQATVKLKSEHSARVMDVGTTPEGTPFMVMEFLEGNDLNQILRHHGPQTPAIVVDLMLQACEGIAEAHALGIIHRDIKPSNFFITHKPDGSTLLKILDFGISKTPVGYDELTGTQMVIGTPQYMAPEQMKSGRFADPRSDIWSIGVVMYQMLTGRPPFAGESYADLVLKVGLEPPEPIGVPLPPGLAELVLRCLEKDPKQRHQNVGDLARMIAPYATDPISSAQAAARVARILQQRSLQMNVMGITAASTIGLSAPIAIGPSAMTPGSWPAVQATSLSHGIGQVTMQSRGGRGWLIAGVAGLCVVAGVGGYAISQLSRADRAPAAAAAPAADSPITPAPIETVTKPPVPVPAEAVPPGHPAQVAPAVDKAAADRAAADRAAADKLAADKAAADKLAADKLAADKAAADKAAADQASAKLAADRAASAKPVAGKPASDKPATVAKPASDKPATARPPAKKKTDDLFDSRR